MYLKWWVLWDVVKVFDEMFVRDIVFWNLVIFGFLSNWDFVMGFKYFREVVELGVDYFD